MQTCVTEKALLSIRIKTDKTDNGSRTSKMELGSRTGQMARTSEAITWMVKRKAMEGGNGQTDQYTRETGMTTRSLALESTNGLINVCTRVNTSEARWRALVNTHIPMAHSIKASTSEIRGRVTASTVRKTTAPIRDLGLMGNNMATASFQNKMVRKSLEYSPKERKSSP